MKKKNEIDTYIATFPFEVQKVLEQIRKIIQEAAPDAEEVISYKMPAYKQNGILVYFAGYKNHIGFYPTASGIENFKEEFGNYKWSKGAVQFPLDQQLPKNLIQRIIKFRIKVCKEKQKQ
jgi:uncharacterized protein YdhG (YjbR/CyaY superfamily)